MVARDMVGAVLGLAEVALGMAGAARDKKVGVALGMVGVVQGKKVGVVLGMVGVAQGMVGVSQGMKVGVVLDTVEVALELVQVVLDRRVGVVLELVKVVQGKRVGVALDMVGVVLELVEVVQDKMVVAALGIGAVQRVAAQLAEWELVQERTLALAVVELLVEQVVEGILMELLQMAKFQMKEERLELQQQWVFRQVRVEDMSEVVVGMVGQVVGMEKVGGKVGLAEDMAVVEGMAEQVVDKQGCIVGNRGSKRTVCKRSLGMGG